MKKIDPGHVLQKRLPGIRFSTWGFPRDYFPAAKNLLERKGSLYLRRAAHSVSSMSQQVVAMGWEKPLLTWAVHSSGQSVITTLMKLSEKPDELVSLIS